MIEKYVKKGICCCKKDCYYDNNRNYSYLIFHEGEIYNFIFEDYLTAWVVFNEKGGSTSSGRRFYINENGDNETYMLSYHKYFEDIRKTKLKKIYEFTEK